VHDADAQVLLDEDDHGGHEEDRDAVEDEPVDDASSSVMHQPGVADDLAQHPPKALQGPVEARRRPSQPPDANPPPDAVGEDQ